MNSNTEDTAAAPSAPPRTRQKKPNALIEAAKWADERQLTAYAQCLLFLLARKYLWWHPKRGLFATVPTNNPGGRSVDAATLATKLGISKPTVFKALKGLQDGGIITVAPMYRSRPDGLKYQAPNLYQMSRFEAAMSQARLLMGAHDESTTFTRPGDNHVVTRTSLVTSLTESKQAKTEYGTAHGNGRQEGTKGTRLQSKRSVGEDHSDTDTPSKPSVQPPTEGAPRSAAPPDRTLADEALAACGPAAAGYAPFFGGDKFHVAIAGRQQEDVVTVARQAGFELAKGRGGLRLDLLPWVFGKGFDTFLAKAKERERPKREREEWVERCLKERELRVTQEKELERQRVAELDAWKNGYPGESTELILLRKWAANVNARGPLLDWVKEKAANFLGTEGDSARRLIEETEARIDGQPEQTKEAAGHTQPAESKPAAVSTDGVNAEAIDDESLRHIAASLDLGAEDTREGMLDALRARVAISRAEPHEDHFERAAILEIEGGLSRPEAERRAVNANRAMAVA